MTDRLRGIAVTVLGIVLALVPPALWVAWTETGLLAVIAIAVASGALLVVLADHGGQDGGKRQPPEAVAKMRLPDECMAELHGIFPLTYHHSLIERTRFRRAMDRIRQRLG